MTEPEENHQKYDKQTKSRQRDYSAEFHSDDPESLDEERFAKIRGPEKAKRREEKGDKNIYESATLDYSNLLQAQVIETKPKGCFARPKDDPDNPIWLAVRKSLKGKKQKSKNILATGDQVMYAPQLDGEGVVEEVLPRTSKLSRPATRGQNRVEHILVANATQLAIVASIRKPILRPGLIDRYLIAAKHNNLNVIVIINKIDLNEDDEVAKISKVYQAIDCKVIQTNCLTGEGVDELRLAIEQQTTVFAGHSGVGKSSLLNRLMPDADIKVGHVPEQYLKGRHTTSTAILYKITDGTFVIDTPGIREFGLWGINSDELDTYFPEIIEHKTQCQFKNCQHDKETRCAVKDAVESQAIHPMRLDSFLRIRESLDTDYWD